MPSTLGIVASGEDVLNDAVFWVDAGRSSVSGGALTNLGTGGSALNAVFGNTTGVDSFDPALLTHTGTNYLYLPGVAGNYASTPDVPVLDITGDIEIVVRVGADSWTPTAEQYVVAKYFTTTSQRSFALSITPTGKLALRNSVDGINAIYRESVAHGLAATSYWFKVTLDVDTGSNTNLATFSYAADQATEPTSWTTISSTTTTSPTSTTTSIFPSSAALEIGSITSGVNSLAGKVYRAIVRNGIGGTTVFDADFTTGITSGSQTTFTESSANAATVTINRATSGRKSVAVVRPILLFGTDDYLEVADNDLLDVGATDSFTVVAVVRQWGTNTFNALIAKKADNLATAAGYALRLDGSSKPNLLVADGSLGNSAATTAAITAGTLQTVSGIRNVALDQLFAGIGNTQSSGATDTTTATLANALPFRIGRYSTSTLYSDMELVAAAVWRRALNANEIATIVNRYT